MGGKHEPKRIVDLSGSYGEVMTAIFYDSCEHGWTLRDPHKIIVIPAKAGIQYYHTVYGFQPSLE